ncbi:metal-dependent hydrolase [Desulfosarcina alkanivorans]|jgi:predicted TIM-barrel fold metal-dependent hydrolase|uniref:Metal-dependent hydrolase n=1 Tax=Desulfosarcina alkanivorans TaxID=571177 RepID=A0A5K7Z7N2_9BACT|nr:amidohydrolase family protein [Desulfosarcina alkanivorans]BBO72517.1 metal-dependent hydrolase [Desulfosarcina alkanivorans]
MLKPHLPTLKDIENHTIPSGFPTVVDAHVHIFPDNMFKAVRRWFDEHAWHIRYQLPTTGVFDFLLSHGVGHIIALQYSHAPGLAGHLNQYMARQCRPYAGRVTGLATIFPGEKNAETILQDAFDAGLGGLKLHAHVQCFDINADDTERIFDVCRSNHKPVVIHIGKEPKSPAYRCDPDTICAAGKLERTLKNFPDLNICVPHLGFSETVEYKTLIEQYDNLWLDTTMALTDYFHIENRIDLAAYRMDRIMYGSDFPNIPYAWDRELKWLGDSNLSEPDLKMVLRHNAIQFFDLSDSMKNSREMPAADDDA